MSKTPYEVRLELLRLAKDALTEQAYNKRDMELNAFNKSRETFAGEDGPRNPLPFPEITPFPTTEDIVAEAEKLNKFVSQQ